MYHIIGIRLNFIMVEIIICIHPHFIIIFIPKPQILCKINVYQHELYTRMRCFRYTRFVNNYITCFQNV